MKVLQVNGFDSYLALKGIRYDDKNEFFTSLEATVREIITSNENDEEKLVLSEILRGYCDLKNFKLKPGHRNFIMNLMLEIDNSEPNEFFKINQTPPVQETPQQVTIVKIPALSPTPVEIKYEISNDSQQQMEEDPFSYQPDEAIFIQEQHPEETNEKYDQDSLVDEEYLLEEYLSEEHRSMDEMEGYVLEMPETQSKRRKSYKRQHRRPERMYNEEFLSTNSNPRRRRVTTAKFYPNTDDGTRERFRDLMLQSMHCILSKEQISAVEDVPIDIEKQNESCWSVMCPLCRANIKLAVVYENNGKYVNYKRSNFERHLRYKHCKVARKPIQFYLPSSPSSITNSSSKFSPCSLKVANN